MKMCKRCKDIQATADHWAGIHDLNNNGKVIMGGCSACGDAHEWVEINKIVNLTPHAINIGERTFPKSETVPRITSETIEVGVVDGIAIYSTVYGEITDLPDPVEGTLFIVSRMIKDRARCDDLVCPGQLVRDNEGRIIGCNGLSF